MKTATAGELAVFGGHYLKTRGVSEPEQNSRWLLAFLLGRTGPDIAAFPEIPVDSGRAARYAAMLREKAGGVPLSYITGEQNFLGLSISVNPAVLIPRPETEELALLALAFAEKSGRAPRVLDLCTGSGCVALAIAAKMPGARITASDISEDALSVARFNARKLGLGANIEFTRSDLFGNITGQFDIIVSNPPYVPEGELAGLQPEVRFEPSIALDGGPDGMRCCAAIASSARGFLSPGGLFAMEAGAGQPEKIASAMRNGDWSGDNISVRRDGAGMERYITGVKNG